MSTSTSVRLKAARKSAGLTQVELAERSGTSQRLVSSLETGFRSGSIETYSKLARVLGVSVSYLLGERANAPQAAAKREEIIHDPATPPELASLARNSALCESLTIQPEEWAMLRSIQSPHILTRDAYVAILHVARVCAEPV